MNSERTAGISLEGLTLGKKRQSSLRAALVDPPLSSLRRSLQAPNADFAARLTAFRKNVSHLSTLDRLATSGTHSTTCCSCLPISQNQMALEKVYKLKLSQEGYVNKVWPIP